MGTGFRPIRGNWEQRQFNTASAATYQRWAPVMLDAHRDLIEATSATTYLLGVAMSGSTDSLPAGKIMVAIPRDFSAVALSKVSNTLGASTLSVGFGYGIIKLGNNFMVDGHSASSQATTIVEIVGPLISATSEIEVQFFTQRQIIPSYQSAAQL